MLNRKMLRDIKTNFSQFVAIFCMVTLGMTAFTGIEAYMAGMTETADRFYTDNNLFDLEAVGKNFAAEDLATAKSLPHVKNAERKLSINATSDHDHILFLNFIETNDISRFHVITGTGFDSSSHGLWLDEDYADKNHLRPGDTITVKYAGLELKPTITGIINVPDHLYDTKDASELIPDRSENGFAYMSATVLPQKLFNRLMIDVDDQANRNLAKSALESQLKSALAIIERENIPSYIAYQGEIDEGKTYVGVFSGLFIFIALLSVLTTMARLIKKQRPEIGALKSLGFSNRKIIFHYLGYGFWVSLAGVISGIVIGFFLIGNFFMALQMAFFEIPNGRPVLTPASYFVGLLVIFSITLTTFLSSRTILKETPAETLRPGLPNVKTSSLALTRHRFFRQLNFSSKWNLRDILRNKARTLMGVAGVTGCAMLIVTAFGMFDSMNHFIKLQFTDILNFRHKLILKEDITPQELDGLKSHYGDATSASLRVEIKTGDQKSPNSILVTDAKDKLRFINQRDQLIKVDSDHGVFLTAKLAKTKGYQIGDQITWKISGSDQFFTSEIVGFNKDPQTQNITMTRAYFERLGLTYRPDALYTDQTVPRDQDLPGVDIVQSLDSLKKSMTEMLSMLSHMVKIIILLAVILGSVIIHNLGILSFTEKQYQFAALKVLGFNDAKIRHIFTKQNNWIAIISILLGLPLGAYLLDWLFTTAIEEHYDFNAHIQPVTFLISALGTFLVSLIVSRLLSRKIKTIDMVTSLKGNE